MVNNSHQILAGPKGKRKMQISAAIKNEAALVKINGPIHDWRNSAPEFDNQIDEFIEKGIRDVTVKLNSPGGFVFQANEIANIIKRFPGIIRVEVGALCASAGNCILVAAKPENRSAAKNSHFMIHRPRGWAEGNEDDMESSLQALRSVQEQLLEDIVDGTNLTEEEVKQRWIKDYWFRSKQALKDGFVSSIEGEATFTEDDINDIKNMYGSVPTNIAAQVRSKKPEPPKKEEPESNNDKNLNSMNKERLIAMFNLPSNATEEQIMAAIQKAKEEAEKKAEFENKLKKLEGERKSEQAEALVNQAVNDGKIPEESKAGWVTAAKANYDEIKGAIDNMSGKAPEGKQQKPNGQQPPQITNHMKPVNGGDSNVPEGREDWNYDKWMQEDPEGLEKIRQDDPDAFKKIWNKSKKNKIS